MIVGTGCDIIDIDRIKKAVEKEPFVKRVYTEKERDLAGGRASFYADNFAVKEAVAKCLGTGFIGLKLTDIEALRHESGKPYVVLHGNAKQIAEQLEIEEIHISISNTKIYSMAFAVAEKYD